MKFQTPYERVHSPKTKNSGERKVNDLGYIPLAVKIRQFQDAGLRLQAVREGFDFDGEIDEDYYPTTRRKNYDMADASMELNERARKAQEQRQAVVKASRKAQEEKKQVESTKTIPEEKKPE